MNSLTLISLSALLSISAHGALVISYAEDSDDFNTKLSGTTVYNFDSLSLGNRGSTTWTAPGATQGSTITVGTYDRLWVKAADQYGGAGNPSGSQYSVQGVANGGNTTLTFTENQAYFGFWWSAGDANNILSFYNGTTLVAQFTTQTLLNALAGSPEYKGNPTTGRLNQNPTESYAFLNFFGSEGTVWNKVTFSNNGTSGFETDNHTTRKDAWNTNPTLYPEETNKPYPGKVVASVTGTTVTVIPEPSSAILPLLGAALLLRRRRC